MSDKRFDTFVALFEQVRGRRRMLQLAATGLFAALLGSAIEQSVAKKKKRKHKRKKKHKKPLSLVERCRATCGATCDACFVLANGSLVCGDTSSLTETPCSSNAGCDDPSPYCMIGAVDRADGVVDAYGDVEGVCASVLLPCE